MAKQLESSDLLKRAEELMEAGNHDELSAADLYNLLHELRLHQAELETQNEELQQIQKDLEESRDKYAELYNLAPVGFLTLDKNNLIVRANLTGASLLGIENTSFINLRFLSFLAKESHHRFYLFRKVVAQTKSQESCEVKILGKDGSLIHAELRGRGAFDIEGNLIQLNLGMHDITKRRQAEDALRDKIDLLSKSKRYESIISYITRVVHRSIDLKKVMENAVQALNGNIEDADFASIYIVEGNEAVLMAHRGYPDRYLERAGRIPYKRGTTWNTIIEGKTRYVADVDQDKVIGPAGRDIGTKSYLSTPIHFEGKAIGTLNINSLTKNAFDEEELKLLEIVARQIEIAINNARQAKSLRISRENYRHLFENVPVGIYRTTPEGHILMANSALLDMLGYPSFEELASNNLEDEEFLRKIPRAKFKEIIERKGEVRGLESVWTRRDGSAIHVSENARAVKKEDGSTLYYEGTVEDITERKKAEDLLNENLTRLDKKNRYESIISSITRSVHSSIDLQEVLDNAVDAMIENIEDLDNVYISLVEGDKAILKAYRGYPTWFVEQVRRDPLPESTSWNTVLELKPRNLTDADKNISQNIVEGETAGKSYLSMPIHLQDQTVGIININSSKKDAFEEEELKLLDVVSRQIEIAISNAHQAEELKRAKEGLEIRVMERTKELIETNESLQKEITWHKWAEDKLRSNEELYRALYDENPSMYFTVNEEGKILSVNKFGAERLGFSTYDLIGQSMLNIVHESDKREASDQIKYCCENPGELVQWEFRKIQKDGRIICVRESARAVLSVDGNLTVLIVSEDISDRKRVEDTLRRHSEILDFANDTILILELNGTIVYWNQGAEWLYGWTKEEIVGKNVHQLLQTIFPEPVERIKETLVREEYWEGELIHTKRDGTTVTVSSRWTLQPGTEENPPAILEINNDITERKEAEETLRQQKELYEAILKAQSDVGECFFLIEGDRILYANEACDQMTGYSLAELAALPSFYSLIVPEQQSLVRRQLENLSFGQILKGRYEITILNKNQEKVTLEISAHPLGVRSTQLIMIGRDITERKRAEEALRESEERFRSFMSHLPGAAWIKDADGRYVYANEIGQNIFNRTLDRLLGKTDEEIFDLDTANQFKQNDSLVMNSKKSLQTIETLPQADGLHHSIVSKFPIFDKDGSTNLVGGIAIDITERKQAEEALRESEERFRTLADSAPVLIWVNGPEGCQFVNREYMNFFGREEEELLGFGWTRFIHPEDYERYLEAYRTSEEKQELFTAEVRLLHADGQWHWLLSRGLPRFTPSGQYIGYVGCSTDISELKIAEQRLIYTYNQAPVGICECDLEGRFLEVNRKFSDITGYTRDELLTMNFRDLTHPDDIQVNVDQCHALKTGETKSYTLEKRYVRKDGRIIWINLTASVVRDPSGMPRYGIGIIDDVTARKAAEEILYRFKFISDNSNDPQFLLNREAKIVYVNQVARERLGYSEEELLGMNILDIDRFYNKGMVKELFNLSGKKRLAPFESQHKKKDGSCFPVETSITGITFKDEPCLFAVARDITERKWAEEELKTSLKEKEVLLKEIHHRVKNNLQIIYSLLSMQSRRIKDKEIREELNDSRTRLEAMSLIHEKLYQSGNLAVVDLAKYIKSLSKHLVYSYQTGSKIKVKINANNVRLPVDKAVPCGLILNELISNSLKHAFPYGKPGQIIISAYSDNSPRKSPDSQDYILKVRDSGVDFPKDLDFRNTKSLGLQLVCSLTKQLRGTIELDTGSGTEFTIKFNA